MKYFSLGKSLPSSRDQSTDIEFLPLFLNHFDETLDLGQNKYYTVSTDTIY